MSSEGKWLINLVDDGTWCSDNEFDTKEEAIAFGKENFNELYEEENGEKFESEAHNKVFYIGKIERYKPTVCVVSVIERLVDNAYDEVGEVAEGFLENVSKDEYKFLEERLDNALNEWLDETKNHPSFFKIVNVEKIECS